MTCIVGLEHDGVVYIGADAAGIDTCLNIHSREDEKVFLVDDSMIMGYTSSFRMGQLLRYAFKIPDPEKKKKSKKKSKKKVFPKSDMEFLVTDVMDSIRELFLDKGFLTKDKDADVGGTFLLGYNGHLYIVEEDFQVGRSLNGYDACGCGGKFALGSIHTTRSMGLDPKIRIKLALEAAVHHSAGVRPPFTILSLGKK